ncbi:MFS transporter asaE [Vanrija pseudolonga]|uniref:MFS transporter asaE n=1 Tax=Vanrija pseudolonga TaxID=143232 RepID=A0AAF0YB13_9TREE|nr:MFS transporter asaE [Vanrija pseudolonga]
MSSTEDIDIEKKNVVAPSTGDGASTPATVALSIEPKAGNDLGPPPDGGFDAWITVFGGFCASFVQFGLANAFGVFQAYYKTHQLAHYSSSTISWIGSVQQFILFFGGLFSGRLFDAYGAKALLVPGTCLFVLAIMMTSLCKEYYQFMLAQGILFGIGSAMIFHPTVSAPSQWFERKRALATSIVVAGSGLGGTLWPIALERLMNEIGFGWALRTAGFLSLALLGVAVACVRTRLPRRKAQSFAGLLSPLKEAHFTLLAVGVALASWGMFMPFFFVTTHAAQLGAGSNLAFYSLSILNAGSTLGRGFAGVADKFGRLNSITLGASLTGILLLAFWIPLNSVPALLAFAPIYGFVAGIIISLVPPSVAQMSLPHQIGARVGLTYGIMAFFTLSGPPINGALLSAGGGGRKGFQYAGAFSGAVVFAGAVCIFTARLKINKKLLAVV